MNIDLTKKWGLNSAIIAQDHKRKEKKRKTHLTKNTVVKFGRKEEPDSQS